MFTTFLFKVHFRSRKTPVLFARLSSQANFGYGVGVGGGGGADLPQYIEPFLTYRQQLSETTSPIFKALINKFAVLACQLPHMYSTHRK